jgi:glycosyltransferase involved in cell wall biosynthesis
VPEESPTKRGSAVITPRVLQVTLSLNPGGTERLVVELTSRLNAEIPMAVCCLDEAGSWASELEQKGIHVYSLGRAPGFRPGLGRALAAVVDRHRATSIHAHHYSPFVYGCLARLWRPTLKVVFTEHGRLSDTPPSARRRIANWVLARFPERVFTVSADLKLHLVAEGFDAQAIDVIYNGIDVGPEPDAAARARAREMLNVSDDTLVIGTIARLDPVKDLGTLIKAVAQLPDSVRASLVVLGDGPERLGLEQTARELSMRAPVCFLGRRDDARNWLAGCDVYVNSSVSEGISLTILEAMAAGLPIIATRVGGTPEVIDDSCGRLIPSRDVGALTAALLSLSEKPALRLALGKAARARVEARFTLDRMVREYRQVYIESTRVNQGVSDVRH